MKPYDRAFYFDQQGGSRMSAKEIVPIILNLVKPKSVIDVGCGLGTWLSVFAEHGIQELRGIDGEWVNKKLLQIPENCFSSYDLTKPVRINRKFDLVVSLEVAEHIPSQFAEVFIQSLVSLGPIILFSAAIPNQGGVNHVNEQWPNYWTELFGKRDYVVVDFIRRKIWQNVRIEPWYAQNILIFVKHSSLEKYPLIKDEFERGANTEQLSIVHPKVYLNVLSDAARKLTLMQLVKLLLNKPKILLNKKPKEHLGFPKSG